MFRITTASINNFRTFRPGAASSSSCVLCEAGAYSSAEGAESSGGTFSALT